MTGSQPAHDFSAAPKNAIICISSMFIRGIPVKATSHDCRRHLRLTILQRGASLQEAVMSTMLSAAARVRKFVAAAFGLRALACVFVLLAQETDETNAAKVDATTWGNMDQVMGGTSRKMPDGLILSPQGLYVIVFAAALYTKALAANPTQPDQ